MKVKGIIWLGTRTHRFEQMTDFCRDLLGLSQTLLEPGLQSLIYPTGTGLKSLVPKNPRTNS